MEQVEIKQIVSTSTGITGLGTDNMLYYWNPQINDWSPVNA